MRTITIMVGIILLVFGVILISVGQAMTEDASRHCYGNYYQSDETRAVLAIGSISILGGFGMSIVGLLITIIGLVERPKRTKAEKLQAKVDEKVLRNKLEELNHDQ